MDPRLLYVAPLSVGLAALLTLVPGEVRAQRNPRETPPLHNHPPPKIGQVVPALPIAPSPLTHRGSDLFFYRGRFYRPWTGGYLIVSTPIGARAPFLPPGAGRIRVGSDDLYYHSGAFFAPVGEEYEVISAPVGAAVETPPVGYSTVVIESQEFYESDGVYHRYDSGRDVYIVVEPPGYSSGQGRKDAERARYPGGGGSSPPASCGPDSLSFHVLPLTRRDVGRQIRLGPASHLNPGQSKFPVAD